MHEKKLELKHAKSAQNRYSIKNTLELVYYITNTLTVGTHLITMNKPRRLAECALHGLLADNNPLHTYFHFNNMIAFREYLIIQKFSGNTTLIPQGKTIHDS